MTLMSGVEHGDSTDELTIPHEAVSRRLVEVVSLQRAERECPGLT